MNKNESKYFKSAEKMHTALLTLLDSKDFELISVKEICETAGVNRSTFYLHYDNVNDLLQETVEAVYKDFFGRFGAEGPGALDVDEKNEDELFLVTPKYLMPYLDFVEENRKLFYLIVMNKYVSLDKRSKKAQREYHAKQRRTWSELNPVTRSVPSGKTYNRKKEKQRIGKEFRNGFEADLFLQNYIFLLDYDVT